MRVIRKGPSSALVVSFSSDKKTTLKTVLGSVRKAGFVPENAVTYASSDKARAVMVFASVPARLWR